MRANSSLRLKSAVSPNFLSSCRLRHQDHVGDKLHQIILLRFRRHRRDLPGLFLSNGKVALVNFNAVDLGHKRILVLGVERSTRKHEQRQGCGNDTGRTYAGRKTGGNRKRHGIVLDEGTAVTGGRADYSPNNRGFAMAAHTQVLTSA